VSDAGVWYFSYGSNLDPERFQARVGGWCARRRAWLEDWRIHFSDEVESEGGGGAVIVRTPGARTWGAIFLIDRDQMRAMDREEFDPSRDPSDRGERVTVTVQTEEGPVRAEVYTIRCGRGFRPPSAEYLGHITRGLRDAGHPDEVVAEVEAAAVAGSSD